MQCCTQIYWLKNFFTWYFLRHSVYNLTLLLQGCTVCHFFIHWQTVGHLHSSYSYSLLLLQDVLGNILPTCSSNSSLFHHTSLSKVGREPCHNLCRCHSYTANLHSLPSTNYMQHEQGQEVCSKKNCRSKVRIEQSVHKKSSILMWWGYKAKDLPVQTMKVQREYR